MCKTSPAEPGEEEVGRKECKTRSSACNEAAPQEAHNLCTRKYVWKPIHSRVIEVLRVHNQK